MRCLLALILLLTFTHNAANAGITAVEGTVADGNTITIKGSGFGVKSPVAPILWDDFEDGIDGARLTTSVNGWIAYSNGGGFFESDDSYSGGLSAYNVVTSDYSTSGRTNYFTFTGTQEAYYSYQSKVVYTGDMAVVKNGRITASTNHYSTVGGIAFSDGYAFYNNGAVSKYNHIAEDWASGINTKFTAIRGSVWKRQELYRKNSTAGVDDGVVYAKAGDEEAWDNAAVTTSATQAFSINSVLLGLETYNQVEGDIFKMYVDDVYVDNTRARVELCTGNTWANRGTCNPQIPHTSWSDTSLQVKVNATNFTESIDAYLYVVDSAGVASEPYATTVGNAEPSTGGGAAVWNYSYEGVIFQKPKD